MFFQICAISESIDRVSERWYFLVIPDSGYGFKKSERRNRELKIYHL